MAGAWAHIGLTVEMHGEMGPVHACSQLRPFP